MNKAVQQLMLGTVCKDENSTKSVLKRIKDAGYDGIELNRFMIHPTPFLVKMLTKFAGMPSGNTGKLNWPELVKEADLKVVSLHTDLNSLEQDYDAIKSDLQALDTHTVVITGMYRFPYEDKDEVSNLAKRLNAVGERLTKDQYRLFYHNHNIELLQVEKDKRALDILIYETNENYVNFELDTYWLSEAGGDPLYWMKRMNHRLKYWHIADRGTRLTKTAMTPILKSDSVELGLGNIPLKELSEYAKEIGVETVVLESHKNWVNDSPIESIEKSAIFFKENL